MPLTPGEMALIPAGFVHKCKAEILCKALQVSFDPMLPEDYGELSTLFGTIKGPWRKVSLSRSELSRITRGLMPELKDARPGDAAAIHTCYCLSSDAGTPYQLSQDVIVHWFVEVADGLEAGGLPFQLLVEIARYKDHGDVELSQTTGRLYSTHFAAQVDVHQDQVRFMRLCHYYRILATRHSVADPVAPGLDLHGEAQGRYDLVLYNQYLHLTFLEKRPSMGFTLNATIIL